ncbi:hypothetical protein T265_14883, partial [Opisthorchis viverrini]
MLCRARFLLHVAMVLMTLLLLAETVCYIYYLVAWEQMHGCTRAGILSGRPHLDRKTIRALNRILWLKSLTARQWCLAGNANALPFLRNKSPHVPTPNLEGQETVFVRRLTIDQPGMRDLEFESMVETISGLRKAYLGAVSTNFQTFLLNFIQQNFQCCGIYSFTEWFNPSYKWTRKVVYGGKEYGKCSAKVSYRCISKFYIAFSLACDLP